MIVPRYWAEARRQEKVGERQFTVRRFGWSDVSEAEAEAHAAARVDEAWPAVVSGKSQQRREIKTPYNGADGVPIREEVLGQYEDVVITRNSYGAKCLNTPDVLFADLDFSDAQRTPGWIPALVILVTVVVFKLNGFGWGATLAATFGALLLAGLVSQLAEKLRGGAEAIGRRRIQMFSAKNPDWHLRVYRTPAGFRVLALHRTFDPAEAAVAECFAALQTDRCYRRMCLNQRCFRARLTAKPWRIGIEARLKPRPGVWPINPERLPERRRWVEAYERTASGFAACRFVEAMGSKAVDAKAAMVQHLHDELCSANGSLPLA